MTTAADRRALRAIEDAWLTLNVIATLHDDARRHLTTAGAVLEGLDPDAEKDRNDYWARRLLRLRNPPRKQRV